MLYFAISTANIILSGTRGYILIFFGTLLVYTFERIFKVSSIHMKLNHLFLLFLILSLALGSMLIYHKNTVVFVKAIKEFLRLNESLGRRVFENEYGLKLFMESSIFRKFFGWFVGTKFSTYYSVSKINLGVGWTYFKIMDSLRFHNVILTILLDIGLFGIGLYIFFFILVLKEVLTSFRSDQRYTMFTYVLLYFISLFFRASLLREVAEFLVLGFVVSLSSRYTSSKKSVPTYTKVLKT